MTRQELSPRAQPEDDFDWWAAPERAREQQVLKHRQPEPDAAPATQAPPEAEPGATPEPQGEAKPEPEAVAVADSGGIYREVQAGAQFRQVRSSYRRFVLPATLAFVSWYLAYVVASVAAPDLMDRPVVGPLNVAWVLGLAQFATTFLTAWLYARNARAQRDRAALGLRWDTQDRLR